MTFTSAFCEAYNETLAHSPFGYVYEKIPILESEVAFSQGLMRLKTVLTMYRQLNSPKLISFIRELDRASPILRKLIQTHYPDLHVLLNPRGGKVPVTYLGKKVGQDVIAVAEKVSAQVLREARKALPKILKALIGAGSDAAKIEIEAALSKAQTIIAKNPEVEWVYIAGWVGLIMGSMAYALMDELHINGAIQSASQPIARWWYNIDAIERDSSMKEATVLHRKLNKIRDTTVQRAIELNTPIPEYLRLKMQNLIYDIERVEKPL